MQQAATAGVAGTEAGEVLAAVAEQLKVPLMVIARRAELNQLNGQPELSDAGLIRTQADAALQLVDSYLLGLELLRGQTQLDLEPVSLASTMADTAHSLERFARDYGVQLELQIAGRYAPVMAHGRALKAALLSLGLALVEAQAAQGSEGSGSERRRHQITLAAHRTPHGIIAGLYGNYDGLRAEQWRTALKLRGRSSQPLTGVSTGSGAGLFVADTIFRSMQTSLRVGHYQHQSGLAATLQPSRQLQFV